MKVGFTIACLLFCVFATAQNECQNSLLQAEKLYQKGQMQEAIKLLEPCAEEKLTKEQRFEAYRLLGLLYQFDNNEEKVALYVKKMLRLRPDYQTYPNMDPPEFTKFVNKFEVRPLLFAGIGVGYNNTWAILVNSHSTFHSPQRYLPSAGYQFGGFVEYMFTPALSLKFNLMMNGVNIRHQIDSAGGWQQIYKETQQYLVYHLAANYQKRIYKKLSGSVGLGFGLNSMVSSMVYFESENIETHSIQLSTKDALPERIKMQSIVSSSVGISYKISKGVLGFEVAYFHFLKNTVEPTKRMTDLNFIMNNQYVNDDIRLRAMAFNISYKMPLAWHIKYNK